MKQYASELGALAQANPKQTIALLASVVTLILALVLFFSLRRVDLSKVGSSEMTKVRDAKRSSMGLAVMASIAGIMGYLKHVGRI